MVFNENVLQTGRIYEATSDVYIALLQTGRS